MEQDKKRHRRSIRLKGFDYAQPGSYLITLCTYQRCRILSRIQDGHVLLSEIGVIAESCWREISKHFPNAETDAFVIMPDHVHGILTLKEIPTSTAEGVEHTQPLHSQKLYRFQHIPAGSVASIIRCYKAAVTREARRRGYRTRLWQKNYWERIIRSDRDHFRIARYIELNPVMWSFDSENKGITSKDLDPIERTLIEKGTKLKNFVE